MSTIRRADLLSISGLRNDGRKPNELRKLDIQLHPVDYADGSAIFSIGLTSALAKIKGPTECSRRSDEDKNKAIVEVNLTTTPFTSTDRRGAPDTRKLMELSRMIQKTFETCICLENFPKQRIIIDCTIISDDGGRLSAAINATTLALIDASIPMVDFCCSCTGVDHLVDLNRREETSQVIVSMLPQRGKIVSVLSQARTTYNELEQVIETTCDGCRSIFDVMQNAVREHATKLLSAKMGQATLVARSTTS